MIRFSSEPKLVPQALWDQCSLRSSIILCYAKVDLPVTGFITLTALVRSITKSLLKVSFLTTVCSASVCFFPASGVTEVWQCPALAAPRFTESDLTYRSCKAVECLGPKCGPLKGHFDEEVHSLEKCPKERQLKHLAASITVLRFCSGVLLLNCSQSVKKCFDHGSLHTKHTGGGLVEC